MAERDSPVALFVAVTVTPGIDAPDWSVTVPTTWPLVAWDWANSEVWSSTRLARSSAGKRSVWLEILVVMNDSFRKTRTGATFSNALLYVDPVNDPKLNQRTRRSQGMFPLLS